MVKQDYVAGGGGVWAEGELFGSLYLMVLSPKMICDNETAGTVT